MTDEPTKPPLEYESATRNRPPKVPIIGIVCVAAGMLLSNFHPRGIEAVDGACTMLGMLLLFIGGATVLWHLGSMFDYQSRQTKR